MNMLEKFLKREYGFATRAEIKAKDEQAKADRGAAVQREAEAKAAQQKAADERRKRAEEYKAATGGDVVDHYLRETYGIEGTK